MFSRQSAPAPAAPKVASPLKEFQALSIKPRSPAAISRRSLLNSSFIIAGGTPVRSRPRVDVVYPERALDGTPLTPAEIEAKSIRETVVGFDALQGPRLERVLDFSNAAAAMAPDPSELRTPPKLWPAATGIDQPYLSHTIPETASAVMCIRTLLSDRAKQRALKHEPHLKELLDRELRMLEEVEFINVYELYEHANLIIKKIIKAIHPAPISELPKPYIDLLIGILSFAFDQIQFDSRPDIPEEWGCFLYYKDHEVKRPELAQYMHLLSRADKADFTPIFKPVPGIDEVAYSQLRQFYFLKVFQDVIPCLDDDEQVYKDWSRLPVYGRSGSNAAWKKFDIDLYQSVPVNDLAMVYTFLGSFVPNEKLKIALARTLTQTLLVNAFATFRNLFCKLYKGTCTLTNDETGNILFFEVQRDRIKVIMTTFISAFTDLGADGRGMDKQHFTPAIPWVLGFDLLIKGDVFEFLNPYCDIPVDFAFTDSRIFQTHIFTAMKKAVPPLVA